MSRFDRTSAHSQPYQSTRNRNSANRLRRNGSGTRVSALKLTGMFICLLISGSMFMFYPSIFSENGSGSSFDLPILSAVPDLDVDNLFGTASGFDPFSNSSNGNAGSPSNSTASNSTSSGSGNTSSAVSNPTNPANPSNPVNPANPANPQSGTGAPSDSVYYYYSIMNEEDRKIYDEIYNGFMSRTDSVPVSTSDQLKLESLYSAVLNDHPEIFWNALSFGWTTMGTEIIGLNLEFDKTESEIRSIQQDLGTAKQTALAAIRPSGDPYNDVKKAFEYVIELVDYVLDSPDNQHVNSSMVNGKSVCAGYAKALQFLLQEMGYQCIYVTGPVFPNEPHAWVLVNINGQYYSMDPTQADNDSVYVGYNPNGLYNYDYFLRGDDFMLRERSYDQNYWEVPKCPSDY